MTVAGFLALLPSIKQESVTSVDYTLKESNIYEDAMAGAKKNEGINAGKSLDIIESMLVKVISRHLKLSTDSVDCNKNVFELGLTSFDVAAVSVELEDDFPIVDSQAFYKYSSIKLLAGYIFENQSGREDIGWVQAPMSSLESEPKVVMLSDNESKETVNLDHRLNI